ncbi:DEAD/DEAH box helicase [Corynebacterium appendicis]|uniref:DEAD/DEAH box helicase n=1 Tax=Corynebacterium appendicis TaxID=163202 RepID=UPI00254D5DF1|nr:DEAD/DEAH box helicase [Corynebacterium appendicis]MDK8624989.1 DEAD/DEAH box helicase [Corynebacterium appendicis]
MPSFSDLGLPKPIIDVLDTQGIAEPFPIQEAAIPAVLDGRDVLGRGPTGSGKTFTFGLPMLALLAGKPSRPGRPRGLILAPTRELAAQIRQRLDDPAAAMNLRVIEVVGGVNINNHIRALAAPVDVLVATPGRAQDLINQGKLSLDDVAVTAIDEADQMADMGFLPQVRKLLDATPETGQRLLFSATLDGDVDKLVRRYLDDPMTHSTAPAAAAVDSMEHYQLLVGDRESRNAVVPLIAARDGKTIMFMRTKHGVDRQVKKLRRVGINAQGLHGDKGQGARTRAIEGFAGGSLPVLVATDIAARGIDISDVSLVVHIDPPAEHKAYLHRAGRTARAGTSGTVVTLVMDEQRKDVDQLLRKAGVDAKKVQVAAGSAELAKITGAREPNGDPLPPPGQAQASPKSRNQRSGGPRRGRQQSNSRTRTNSNGGRRRQRSSRRKEN